MKLTSNELFKAVRYALYTGATATVGFSAVPAFAQDNSADSGQKLDTITVTGSNIRRVDIETSNPVITVDRAAIQRSGKVTVGDLLQELPTVAGAAQNPNVNNGGGSGASFISLRGLGTNRTLILIDGKRVINADVNAIPASAIERIEVLTDGASAVYGSDAIAGVVNFIMRKDYQGAELSLNYGISDRDDGARKGFTLTFGQTSDKGSLIGGIDYNKSDSVANSHRDYSKIARTLTPDGQAGISGSTPTSGYFSNLPQFANCSYYGYGTFDPAAPGGNGAPAGFRCFRPPSGSNDIGDLYNYQAVNLIVTPQERTNLFLSGNYKLTDSVEAYFQAFHNSTNASSILAPAPVSLATANLTVAADNPYNPFGVAVGRDGDANLAIRLGALGPRTFNNNSKTDQGRVGLKGNIFDTDWQFDLWGNYGHEVDVSHAINFFNAATAATALSGNCILPADGPLSTNTCLNIFNQLNDPITSQLLQQFYSLNANNGDLQTERQGGLDVNGSLFELPGGTVSIAAGVNYRKFYIRNYNDTVENYNVTTNSCPAGTLSLCNSPFSGGFNVKEAYVEMLVPILKDIPFIHSLNVTLGDRFSKYNTFGSTNNWKAALEYRPIEDLLLRGTVSKVFRAPNTTELFQPTLASFDTYLPGPGEPRSSANATQVQTVFTGASVGGFALKPENGKTFDFGVVYDPQWLPGLSLSADLWRIYLLNIVTRPTGQTVVDFCYANGAFGGDSNPYCSLINFNNVGAIDISGLTFQNFGRLDTQGVDFAGVYKLPETAFGNFSLGLNTTYLKEYNVAQPGAPTAFIAGTHQNQYGAFPRWRAEGSLTWQLGDFSVGLRERFIGRQKNVDLNVDPYGFQPVGAVVYHNIQAGYNIEAINTRIDAGVDNLGDKQPPLYYQSGLNSNIDVNTFDTIGRFYYGRVTVKF